MKRFIMLISILLCITVPLLFMDGCAKKEAEKKAEPEVEVKEEVAEPETTQVAPAETTAVEEGAGETVE